VLGIGALRGKLAHEDLSVYNAAQRAAYLAIILCAIVLVFSGSGDLEACPAAGDQPRFSAVMKARGVVHFLAMALLVLIVVVHVVMVIPRARATFPTMITGRARRAS